MLAFKSFWNHANLGLTTPDMGFKRFKGQKSKNAIRCSRRFMFLSILWEESALEENMKVLDIFLSFPMM